MILSKAILTAILTIWSMSGNGNKNTEAVFTVDGSGSIIMQDNSNEYHQNKVTIIPGLTAAVFHTHPNRTMVKPSPHDVEVAKHMNVCMFVVSQDGLWEYNPKTNQTTHVLTFREMIK